MRLLLVEDDAPVRESLRDFLRDRHELVLEAENGQEALKAIDANEIDVVIADIRMPILDGIGLLRILEKTHPALRVVLVSGHADLETAIAASRHHAYDFIQKPYNLVEIERVIRKIAREMDLERKVEHERARANAAERISSLAALTIAIMHEINNPHTVIIGNLQYLTKRFTPVLDDPQVRAALQPHLSFPIDEIAKSIHSMEKASERLRAIMARIPSSTAPTLVGKGERANLEECLVQAVERTPVGDRRPFFKPRTDRGSVLIAADAEELTMLFSNLITNALEATASKEDGEVRITTEMSGDRCVVEIRDNGVGIDPEMIKRMCEPFSTSKRDRPGRGLGLWIVHQLATRIGGRLEWNDLPQGADFRLSLPCTVEAPERAS